MTFRIPNRTLYRNFLQAGLSVNGKLGSSINHNSRCIRHNSSPAIVGLPLARLHDRSPSSFGVYTQDGYLEFIPSGISLPWQQRQDMQTTLDYTNQTTLSICYRRSILHSPVIIQTLVLQNMKLVKANESKISLSMRLDSDLHGYCVIQDLLAKRETSISFDGKVAFEEGGDREVALIITKML